MDTTIRTYSLAWLGLMVIAMLNGALRDLGYRSLVGDLAAHQISTVTVLVLFSVALTYLMKRSPIDSLGQAWTIGGVWFMLTGVFEVGMSLMSGASWTDIVRSYDLSAGQLWILVHVWTLAAPPVFFWDNVRQQQRT